MADGAAFPLTPIQQVFHAGQALVGDAPVNNMAWRFEISGPLDVGRFQAAFDQVAARHDGLRLRVIEQDGRPCQILGPASSLDETLDGLDVAAADDWIARDIAQPFDLNETTWRSRLIRVGPERTIWYFCQHHIASDAMSGQALFRAVSDAYEGVPETQATQFTEFALRDKKGLHAARAHWAEVAEAATDRAPPYGKENRDRNSGSTCVEIDFGNERIGQLNELASAPGFRSFSAQLSTFAILVSIHAAWIHRLTGNRRICIGTPAHLRLTPQDRAAIGLFAEAFPFRLVVEPGDSFRTVFDRAMAEAKTWLRYATAGASTPASVAAFRGVLNYLPMDFGSFAGMVTAVSHPHAGAHDPNQDHQLNVLRFSGDAGAMTLQFRLNRQIYVGGAQQRAPQHWLQLADAMLADPDVVIDAVPLGGSVLKGPPVPDHDLVLDAFAKALAKTPEAIAISQGDRSLSYRAFDAMVSEYAEGCRAAGVQTGDLVLVWAARSVETVAAIWGVLRAGATYVPFPASTPPARIRAVVERFGITAAVKTPEADALKLPRMIVPAPARSGFASVSGTARAYVTFTSGSTGEPKGVAVDHENLAAYVAWNTIDFPGDHSLATSIGFDTSISPLFLPLTTGRTLRVYPETGAPDLAIREVVREDQVDVANLTPSQYMLAFEGAPAPRRLRTLKFCGEALPRYIAQDALDRGLQVGNEYGPSECVVGSTLEWFTAEDDGGATVSVGRPGPGVDIAVMDAHGNPLPVGLAGEIYIGGRLANGYLDQPELTADRFVDVQGQRMYRTGDVARLEEDGTLSFLGRVDHQLKISGVRVEPAETIAALQKLPGVTRAHVGPYRESEDAPAELAAWVMGKGEPADWVEALRSLLPPEMTPTRVAKIAHFPLLPSGKVDQKSLPPPSPVSVAPTRYELPAPGVEQRLAELIASELKLPRVGARDNFYALGLDSLAAVRLSLRAGQNGMPLDPAAVFEHQNVRALALHITRRSAANDPTPVQDAAPLVSLDAASIAAIGRALNKG